MKTGNRKYYKLAAISAAVLSAALLAGCGTKSEYQREQILRESFSDEVRVEPITSFQFIVKDSEGEIWIVRFEVPLREGVPTISSKRKLF